MILQFDSKNTEDMLHHQHCLNAKDYHAALKDIKDKFKKIMDDPMLKADHKYFSVYKMIKEHEFLGRIKR